MANDWFVSEETEGGNPDIYVESRSEGTICQIMGGPLERRRANARFIAKAPTLELLPALLDECDKAIKTYEWITADHPELDPDGDLPRELKSLRRRAESVRQAMADIPNIFEDL